MMCGDNSTINNHFIGSIVHISKKPVAGMELDKFLVIDGQQRLTTISLIIMALCELLRKILI